jgi:hypothetical protein
MRLEVAVADEGEGERWFAEQLPRVARGLEPEKPTRQGSVVVRPRSAGHKAADPGQMPTLESIGRDWHSEYFEELERTGAERSRDAERDLELHIYPAFGDLLGRSYQEGHQMVKDWTRAMSGRRPIEKGGRVSRYAPGPTRYASETVSGFLWLLKRVLGPNTQCAD